MTAALLRLLDARWPARPVALMRVLVATAALIQLVTTGRIALTVADPDAGIRLPYVAWAPAFTPTTAWVFIAVWLAAGLLFAVGWRARWTGGVLAATLFWGVLFDQQAYLNRLYLLSTVVTLLAIADSGAIFSLDARRRGPRPTLPAWPVFLLRAQLTIVYAFTALSKVNREYLSGYVVRTEFPVAVLEPLLGREGVVAASVVLAWVSVALELALPVLFWLPAWRPAAIALGLILHVGVLALMNPQFALSVFGLTTFSLYLPFLDARPASRTVVWDEGSVLGTAAARWIRRLDWLRVYELRPSTHPAARAELRGPPGSPDVLVLIGPDGQFAGFSALGRVLELLPVSFLWAPFLRLPGVKHLGDWLFRRYARRRRAVPPAGEPALPRAPIRTPATLGARTAPTRPTALGDAKE